MATPERGGWLVIASAVIAALGSFLFGFDTAVISGTTEALSAEYELSPFWLGFTVMSALIGTMFGALAAARPSDLWGRRPTLVIVAVLYLVSAIGCGLAWNWYGLLFFRWLGGVAVGGASVVSPMYISEISPPKRRGLLVGVAQLNIVIGILAAYLSNYLVAEILGPDHPATWRWMLGMLALPSVLFLLLALLIPESPRWLVKRGRLDEARQSLTRLGHENAGGETQEIAESLQSELSGHRESLFQGKYMKPLLLALMIAVFNQLDGINAVLYYTADIFRMAGADKTSALTQSVIIGLTNLVMTLVAMAVIDRVGRKLLLLVGSITFILSHGLAAWVFHTHAGGFIVLLAMMGVVASHAYSQGAVVWVCINELLPNAVRASGSALVCFVIWALCAGISLGFPVVAAKSGAYVFGFFAMMMVVQFVLVLIFLPETKGRSLEDIERQLTGAGGRRPAPQIPVH